MGTASDPDLDLGDVLSDAIFNKFPLLCNRATKPMITQILFYFLTTLAILSAFATVFLKNPIYNVLALIVNFFCIAGHYLLLNAQFLAAVHIIVYSGAIMVLFLYVIMMLNLNYETEVHKSVFVKVAAVVSGGLLLLTLVGIFKEAEISATLLSDFTLGASDLGTVENIGKVLFGEFLLPFEVSSILFLAAMVGAVMIGKREIK